MVGFKFQGWTLRKHIFDFQREIYWETPAGFGRKEDPKLAKGDVIELKQVPALQVLREDRELKDSKSGRRKTHTSYELNFVLEGARYNIIDPGSLKSLVHEAHALSQKMGVPLLPQKEAWDRL